MSTETKADGSALSKKQATALGLFTDEWTECPMGVHIKTLVSLIRKRAIEWRDRLPFIGPEFHRWKTNCEFRKTQNTPTEKRL